MNRLFHKIVHRVCSYTQKLLQQENDNRQEQILSSADRYSLVDSFEVGVCVQTLKEASIEEVEPMPIYGILQSGVLRLNSPALNCYCYKQASVREGADYILFANERAVWTKKDLPIFTKDIPMDEGLLYHDASSIIVSPCQCVKRYKKVFSMCGVYADVWAHFMIQYVCKLYSLLQLPAEHRKDMAIMVPEYQDEHVKYVMETFVSEYLPGTELCVLHKNEMAFCEELYYVESTTTMIDNERYVSYVDMIIPKYVNDLLKRYMIPSCVCSEPTERIFLVRRGSWRNMSNSEEVETYFASLGFRMVEPHKMSYTEKVGLFQSAKVIVGPYSSAFTNTIFCRPGTKVLVMTNLQRAFEPFLTFYRQYFDLDMMCVTGVDEQPSESQSSYEIPLQKVICAYKELLNIEKRYGYF